MKFSELWLADWISPLPDRENYLNRLIMAGIEVESLQPAAEKFSGVVVAEIISVAPHTDLEQLNICKVDTGDAIYTVVSAAQNILVGTHVAYAKVGAILPNKSIQSIEFKGIQSEGMLCSKADLGLEQLSEVLLTLSQTSILGKDVWEELKLDDNSIELKVTPNRGDCLSLRGIARELSVLTDAQLSKNLNQAITANITDQFPIKVSEESACPRYTGRVLRHLDPTARTPLWMAERLRRSGMRSIHLFVDITNYVMLELGQPMHAFDLDTLVEGIHVRLAKDSEEITLLDGQTIQLRSDTLVIADQQQALAIAGIMGGETSAVNDQTCHIFLESAFFSPQHIAGKARSYKLQTDSSYRFERGVDFNLPRVALERATQLYIELAGAQVGPVIEVSDEQSLPERQPIDLRVERIQRVLGMAFNNTEIVSILTRLGMTVEQQNSDLFAVTPPSYRYDISIESDLIEELARINGYDKIPNLQPLNQTKIRPRPEHLRSISNIKQTLVNLGYQEAITYSFIDPEIQAMFCPGQQALTLANPIAKDLSVMRASLWPGLVQAAKYNLNRQFSRIRLFEIGRVYKQTEHQVHEIDVISGIAIGPIYSEQWGIKSSEIDFYDIKGDLEALLSGQLKANNIAIEHAEIPALHPGQSATILSHNCQIGTLGKLHPSLQNHLDIKESVFLFELELSSVQQSKVPKFSPISKFPSVRRDISLLVDETISAARLCASIKQHSTEMLKDFVLFDLYQGEGIDSKKKSVALGLIFQGTSSTLVDKEIDGLIEGLLVKIYDDLGATLRN